LSELTTFLNIVFVVMFRLGTYGASADPQSLATVTADALFEELGIDEFEGLTLEQFNTWMFGPSGLAR
jgi:hypothetical protein